MTYEEILKRALDRVPNNIDKREGSLIFNAIAPAAFELAEMYFELDFFNNRFFADTATGDELTRRCAERGVVRKEATKAIRKGEFNITIPIGSRFGIDNLIYKVIEQIDTFNYKLECETAGNAGNKFFGQLLPIDYVEDLTSAILTDILIPGEDEETDDELRKRYFDGLNSEAFGGNTADYKDKTNSLDGVGGVKVYPVWNGGGTVKLVIIDSSYNKPSSSLITKVQTAIDPIQNQGKGLGIAPIGHTVTVEGVTEITVNISSNITLVDGYVWDDVEPYIQDVLNDYFLELRKSWADKDSLVVRISQIESSILTVTGVLDIQDTTLNSQNTNLILNDIQVPILGTVVQL